MKYNLFTLVCAAILAAIASPLLAANAPPNGRLLFQQRCASCHAILPGKKSLLAPHLGGVMDRAAASTPFKYSPALKASKLVWTRDNLDRFISGPARMVPGTRMMIVISDPAQRAAIIDYLANPM